MKKTLIQDGGLRPNQFQIKTLMLTNHITDSDFYNNYFNKPKILIAGSGTGQQIIGWSAFKNSQIIAVDLSKESLAYSIRKSEEVKHQKCKTLSFRFIRPKIIKSKVRYDN